MLACGTTEMGVRRYCCSSSDCTHSRFFCQSCKSKACSACGFKATEQWISQQSHILPDCDWQHITFTMPHLLWPFFNNNWTLLNALFRAATRAILRWVRKQDVEVGIFCALHTYGRQLNPHRQQTLTREEMIGRYISHIPAKHFKMVRDYGFLSNRKRGELLPKVYEALQMHILAQREPPFWRCVTSLPAQ
ncbi:hypothetical protein SK92_05456 [Klebsiella oxytoca]|nr:hypothetical protein SK92_05456 [Klebsiella oxytoca]